VSDRTTLTGMSADTPSAAEQPPLRLGIAGLGLAAAFMIRAAAVHPHIRLCAGMDPLPRPREAFAQQFDAKVHADFAELCRDASVEAIYIASPHRFHAAQAIQAMEHGKHVLVEKPLALTIAECDAVAAAADRTGMQLIVGHTHAFDPNVREMRRIIRSGELGRLGMILSFNYNDFLLRPHRDDEFDPERGGGIAFNQLAHQIEILRLLGGNVRAVRASVGALDSARPAAGHCTAFLDFECGAAASVTFSAYDFFDSDEWHHWIGEGGAGKEPGRHGRTRRAFMARTNDLSAHEDLGYGGRVLADEQPHLPHFGLLIVTCERGDMRLSPAGILIHGVDGTREVAAPRSAGRPGQGDALDALWLAVREGRPSIHDARWGRDTVATIIAALRSSQTRREVAVETGTSPAATALGQRE
jgi:phthalate 4,5-cis-dihydrodiol dehydrogenase